MILNDKGQLEGFGYWPDPVGGTVMVRMTPQDYKVILMGLASLEFYTGLEVLGIMNRINQGNSEWTPYHTKDKLDAMKKMFEGSTKKKRGKGNGSVVDKERIPEAG